MYPIKCPHCQKVFFNIDKKECPFCGKDVTENPLDFFNDIFGKE